MTQTAADNLYEAALALFHEIDTWEIPQVDEDGVYGPTTCVAQLQKALEEYEEATS